MRRSGGGGRKKQPDAIDEVEELLKVTEDDLLLKLTVNSHTKSKSKFDFVSESSSNAIDPDLDRRFQALRSKTSKSNPKPAASVDHEDDDNLFARFAALKAPSSSSTEQQGMIVKDEGSGVVGVEDEEDEVSKIINWAIDAARLDPSPSSDVDDEDEDEDDNSEDDSGDDFDDDKRTSNRKRKGSKK